MTVKKTTVKNKKIVTSISVSGKTQKAAVKKTAAEVKKAESPVVKNLQTFFSGKTKKRNIIIVVLVIAIVAVLFYFRNQFIVATVNGEPITRLSLIKELEVVSGKKTLDYLTTKTVIFQEARKQNIVITEEDINKETKRIETDLKKQNQSLKDLLSSQDMTLTQLRDQLKLQLIINKILAKDVKIADSEINDYITKNKDFLPKNMDEKQLKTSVKERLFQQKINQLAGAWVKGLRDKAKIKLLLNF